MKNRRKPIKIKKHLGYSEKLVVSILLFCCLIIISAVIYAFIYNAYEIWSYILDVVRVLSSSTVVLFIWKARGENIIKIKNNPDFNLNDYAQKLWQEWEEEHDNIGREQY